jgi:hypothetical protein
MKTTSPHKFAALASLLVTSNYAQAADDLVNHVPDGSAAVLSVNLRRIANDPLTSHILALKEMRNVDEKIRQVSAATNIDPRRDLDRLIFAKGAGAREDAVLLLKGKFDPARIRPLNRLANGNAETTAVGAVDDVLTWKNDEHEKNYLAFLPDGIAILGFSPETVEAAISPRADALQKLGPTLAEVSPKFQESLAWLHVSDPASLTGDAEMKTIPVESVDAVLDSNADQLSATVHARIESAARAKDLLDMANGLLALAKLKNNAVAQRVTIGTDATSRTLIASLNYSRPELMEMAEKFAGNQGGNYSRRHDISTTVTAEMETARRSADFARQNAELARKQAELARRRSALLRERARVERELRRLDDNAEDDATTATLPPEAPLPPVPPSPPIPTHPSIPAPRLERPNPATFQLKLREGAMPPEVREQIQSSIQNSVEQALRSAHPAPALPQRDN